jgi:hypothetical protein
MAYKVRYLTKRFIKKIKKNYESAIVHIYEKDSRKCMSILNCIQLIGKSLHQTNSKKASLVIF